MMESGKKRNFMGQDGFCWWIGIVENRIDPLNLGRCQVRIKGLHSPKDSEISSDSLPWAQPLFPINQSFSVPTTLKDGDMVVGFFMDGESAQYPIIFGMFHGIPEDAPDPNTGFGDRRTEEQLKNSPRKPKSVEYDTSGSGAKIVDNESGSLYPNNLNEPTTDRLSRNENIDGTIVKAKNDAVITTKDAKGKEWKEPKSPYNAKYPYNHVFGSESGHYLEFDDSPGAERVHLYHRSGSFHEIHPDGSEVTKIVKNKYSITMSNDNVYIMGDCSITVQGNAQVYVQKDCELKVDGSMNQTIGKDLNLTVEGNVTTKVSGSITQTSIGDTVITASSIELIG